MKKNKTIIIFLVFSLVLDIVLPSLVSAQTCDTKIPIGEAIEKTIETQDRVFKEIQTIHQELNFQINAAMAALGSVSNCNPKICDEFNQGVCPPAIFTFGITLYINWERLYLDWLLGKYWDIVTIPLCFSLCNYGLPCKGTPCPSIKPNIDVVDSSIKRISDSISKINDVFSSSTELVDDDIIAKGESSSTKISIFEFTKRKLKKAQEEFDNCAMSYKEWELASQGKYAGRNTIRCFDIFRTGLIFQPQKWPQGSCENASELCRGGLSYECFNCVCPGLNYNTEGLKQCEIRLCQSAYNWTCCR
ncbi:hypothetical protein COS93_01150 [bacterium (Candidatus Gribaldobacteria) CG07_land_8_20_14_0_80_33_18]|uniref:Uncharacterized protein n=1 Tax=bacterium (Candidatus Gribaldobacteria) CG07_land_8_20_14_0_80_33_18 TaxID=2014272 RepID=A0A2M6Z3L2_9BACT|nr:MAG: hypothetical protein COU04_01485 [bacterium (Candidatus Gribaldobacteria) CG10_big_fil_rev_8_21_14_0_10_33_41]PIU46999.1 MAG: hypothetical protein COS93_01150 [bacterium (Candidatus Gribaldobacteria) CG07_land_8_20_14_0_80_33_18]PJA01320.1 MAG: hypothetical protein COX75_00155 [bacterium (Candidatus Gribaldobacteria) CG_4_10_14_0_2_um_filter_33_15]PJB08346.1 MAG: hypothetical protein CO122_02010 [bacterium (Candidatus Gribaldobacteria) CG_4_9_14_3_um_filter_33_9]